MKNSEAIQRLLSEFQAYNNDSSISRRFVFSILKSNRAELLKQEAEKKRLWNGFSTQAINCFKLIPVDISECCSSETGSLILRSEVQLPKLIDTIFGKIITGVYDIMGNEIDKSSIKDWNLIRRRPKRLSNRAKYFIRNDYIYVVDLEDIESLDYLSIVVEGIFEDTEVVERLNNCDCVSNCTMSALDYEFNCPGYIERRLFLLTAQEIARKLGIPRDMNNNAKDDINPARVEIPKEN